MRDEGRRLFFILLSLVIKPTRNGISREVNDTAPVFFDFPMRAAKTVSRSRVNSSAPRRGPSET
jgi:hypothetical protein